MTATELISRLNQSDEPLTCRGCKRPIDIGDGHYYHFFVSDVPLQRNWGEVDRPILVDCPDCQMLDEMTYRTE